MSFEPNNILLINFGQIGDVILSLPAMRALRERFAGSKLTFFVGTSARAVVEMSGLADEIISVDRVELRDSNPLWSIKEIAKLVSRVRKKRFDFVIDLHSLPETNLLGYLTGAKKRFYVDRRNRSLNFLSNFHPKPPPYQEEIHISEYYLRSLKPLGVKMADQLVQIVPSEADVESVSKIFDTCKIKTGKLIGIHFGAGAPSRRSSLASFGKLAQMLQNTDNYEVVAYSGPEEAGQLKKFFECFPENVPLLDSLSLKELAAAFTRMEAVIGNDSGPIHLAGAVGVPVILITGQNGLSNFTPLAKEWRLVENADLDNIDSERVLEALKSLVD